MITAERRGEATPARERDAEESDAGRRHVGGGAKRYVRIEARVGDLPQVDVAHERVPGHLDDRGQDGREELRASGRRPRFMGARNRTIDEELVLGP